MRKLIVTLFVSLFFANAAWADKEKIIVHITDKRNAYVVHQAISNLIDHYGDDREIILVANGPAVELFTRMLGKETLVDSLQINDVSIGVCSIALERYSIPQDMLFEGVEVFQDSGIVRIIELQKQGYMYVKI
jgi:intracellular sulfur oxidation DsrE/DsrF family protein